MRIKRTLRMIALTLISVLLLNCAGCWDRREIDKLNVVMMLGVDRVVRDGKTRVLLSVLSLKLNSVVGSSGLGQGAGLVPSMGFVDTAEGETIDDACRNIALRSPRSLYLGHVQAIVIGEEMARDGIQQVIDFGDRSKDIRYRTEVVTCQGSALEALEAQPEFEMLSSTELVELIKQDPAHISKTVPADLLHVVSGLMTPGREVAMPRLHLFSPPERGSSVRKGPPSSSITLDQQGQQGQPGARGQNFNQTLGVSESEHPERKVFSVDGTAVFLGDRLVGWLNGEESEGAMFITRQARGGEVPFAFRSSQKNASYAFQRVSAGVKPVITRDGITLEVNIRGSGGLSENRDAAIDTMKASDIKAAEQYIDAEAEHYCQEAVARCQSLQSDIFGFGDLIHKSNPAYWKQIKDQWRDRFPTVKVRVTARFTIEQTGVTGQAVKSK